MKNDIPEDIVDALDLLHNSEKERSIQSRVKLFCEGMTALNQCVSEYPEHSNTINKCKLSQTRSLIITLKQDKPYINRSTYLDILITVISGGRNELKQLVATDRSLVEYLKEFMMLWSNDVSSVQIKAALDDILK
jgi:hypothetical protein